MKQEGSYDCFLFNPWYATRLYKIYKMTRWVPELHWIGWIYPLSALSHRKKGIKSFR